jgi:diguanylate cyclase (GGDEF)-like protein
MQSGEGSKTIKEALAFFVAHKLYELIKLDDWQEVAKEIEYAVVAFSSRILYANEHFYHYFPNAKSLQMNYQAIEQLVPQKAREEFLKLLNTKEAPEDPVQHFCPEFFPLTEQLSEHEGAGVLCIHPLAAQQSQALLQQSNEALSEVVYLAVWIDKYLLSQLAQEESLILKGIKSGLSHVRVEKKSGETEVLYASPGVADIWEYRYEDFIRELLVEKHWWFNHLYEPDKARVLEEQVQLQTQGELEHDYRIVTAKGKIKWVRETVQAVYQDDNVVELLVDAQDATQQQILNIKDRLFAQAYKALQQATNENVLFDLLCQYLADVPTIQLVWIGVPSESNTKIIPQQKCGTKEDYISEDFSILLDGSPKSQGPSGGAWQHGFAINPNTKTNPRMTPWKEQLLAHHMFSSCAIRIDVLNKPTVLLNIYSDQPEFFNESIIKSIKRIQHLISEKMAYFRESQKLWQISYFSRVTQDPNLTSLLVRLERFKQSERAEEKSLVLVYLNIKEFSQINILWGIEFGDQVIKSLSKVLHQQLKQEDEIYHVGADHFVLCLFDIDKSKVVQVVNRLQQQLESLEVNEQEVGLQATFSVVLYPDDCHDASKLYEMANLLEHQNLDSSVRFFSPDILQNVTENLKLRQYLVKAIHEEKFNFYYQPIISTQQRNIINAEVLIRLNDEAGNPISPERFITIAEKANLITQITPLVIKATVQQFAKWQKSGLPIGKIAINLSAQDIENEEDLLPFIEEIWLKNHVFPEHFAFEITERIAVSKYEQVVKFIERLKELGTEMELDDFGVGYSSLHMLNELDVTIIKIDKHFVDKLLADRKTRRLVQMIIDTTHDLGAKTVAEGVEQAEQFEALKEMGCDYIQGYYIAKPMPPEAFERFVLEYTQQH